ncbi:MAG TPA: histidine phosphatase family protein [Candidatus Dormibacteraeota bacterium]|nr:histidine phosphatase family protein [Candidatus Dormibacteraeota bacterium]
MGTEIAARRPEPAEPPQLPLYAESAPTRLVLVRHGQSTWNREHRIQGQLDPPLSAEGLRQAELLGLRLAARRFAGFYASDLARAFQTAEAIGAAIGQEPVRRASLREIFLGEWEGLTTAEIAERYPREWAAWVQEPDWDLVPGGEGAATFDARVARALDEIVEIVEQHRHGGDVLVVTHGGVIQVALHRIIGRASRGLFPFKIQNASISWIEKRTGRTIIGGVNDIAHLEPALVTEVGPG